MTMPEERTRAVLQTREFLRELMETPLGGSGDMCFVEQR